MAPERILSLDYFFEHPKEFYQFAMENLYHPDAKEWFTLEGFTTILNMIDQADCLLVLGSSLKVTPFSNFPQYRPDVLMIIINKGTTPYDWDRNSYVIRSLLGIR